MLSSLLQASPAGSDRIFTSGFEDNEPNVLDSELFRRGIDFWF